MATVTLSDVKSARERISARTYRTPIVRSNNLSQLLGLDLYLKVESLQKTGSYKVRGAVNRVAALTAEERTRGVVSMSAGNFAQALAFAASSAGVKSTVVMPATAVKGKVEATKSYGAEVVQTPGALMDTVAQLQRERGLVFIHPFDDALVIAGAGTLMDEVMDDVPDPDLLVFGVGGGGLGAGCAVVARARRPSIRIVGVEPEGAQSMKLSYERGKASKLEAPAKTVADGLAAPFAGELNYALFRDLGVEMAIVGDDAIVDAMWLMIERTKILVEPAAAAPLAALRGGAVQPAPKKGTKVVVIVSGGNVDAERLGQLQRRVAG